ncbi:MBL fold metallo-hydrolase [Pseudonocardia nigra]|uniref:MBL fold metallo-hydrolase n=1 Tax=Pseudonocardia nigra TaxID=1921578 RepID=UPI001C603F31|nr:MBL fold metallo-hydrolase [Pseudonocardia nigra]
MNSVPRSPECDDVSRSTGLSRRGLLAAGATAAAALALPAATACARPPSPSAAGTDRAVTTPPPAMSVHLIGTGGPEMSTGRQGMSTLVDAGGQRLLFDVGRGATQNLYESRINPKDVTQIFLTHLHNDHYEGLPTLWLNPWFLLGRTENLQLWGPHGTADMVAGMRMMYAHDLDHRANDTLRVQYLDIDVTQIEPGVVYERAGVVVTAFPVEHRDGNPAFGYRVDHAGRSVLLSGDTIYHENVVEHGRGVDVLIHNVLAFSDELTASGRWEFLEEKLATPEQAAAVFLEANPRVAVYSHIAKKGLHGEAGDRRILERTRAAGYDGELHMGVDRMTIEVDDRITVAPPASTHGLPELDSGDVELDHG